MSGMKGPTAPVKKEEEEAGADVRGLVALPTGLHGCRPTTMTLYGSLGQVRISVAALGADFLDEKPCHRLSVHIGDAKSSARALWRDSFMRGTTFEMASCQAPATH